MVIIVWSLHLPFNSIKISLCKIKKIIKCRQMSVMIFFCFPYFAIMRGSRCAAKIPMKLSIYYNYFFYSKESSPPYSCALLDFESAHVGNFLLSLCWYTFLKITFACLCSSWFFSFRSFILFKIFICLLQYINI